jgi:hypothetical protein
MRCSAEKPSHYAYYLDMPEGLGKTREQQLKRKSKLVQQIEALDAPFVYFGCWPDGRRAALSITGDIDSVTVQDFLLRIIEVHAPFSLFWLLARWQTDFLTVEDFLRAS